MKKITIQLAGFFAVSGLILSPLFAVPTAFAQYYGYQAPQYNQAYTAPTYAYGSGCVTLSTDFGFGSSGAQVTQLQQFLISQGYLNQGLASGYFGAMTRTGVKAYQYAHELPNDGYVGIVTRTSIQNISCGNYGYNTTTNYNNNNTGYYGTPTVSSLSLYSGGTGAYVTIYGQGFDATNNIVNFDGVRINNVTSYNNGTSLSFNIPATSQNSSYSCSSYYGQNCYNYNQPVQGGVYPVSVTTSRGTSNSQSFTVVDTTAVCGSYNGYYNYNTNCQNYNNNYLYNNSNPVIGSVNGPTNIGVNAIGTWSLSANTNNSGYLNSNLTTTVNWGDQNNYYNSNAAQTTYGYGQNVSFTHTYRYPGTYTVTFTVRDSNGSQNSSSITVVVTNNYYTY